MSVWHYLLSVLSILSTRPIANQAHAMPLTGTQRWDRMTVKHSWNAVPQNWESLGHPPADSSIDLYLALKPQHENALIDTLHEVSDPRHAKYGEYLNREQVAELVAPHPDTLALINSWLKDHGIPSSSVSTTLGGNWLKVSGVPVPQASDILGASYQLYHHAETNDTVVRTLSYSLPEALHGHIQTVAPTTYFDSPRAQRNEPRIHTRGVDAARGKEEPVTALSSREEYVTPSYLRWLYKTLGYKPAAVKKNGIGVVDYSVNYPNPQDLHDFMGEYRTDGEKATFTFTVAQLDRANYNPKGSQPGIEANLNLQLAEAMTYPTANTFYTTGGGAINTKADPYLAWLEFALKQPNLPRTITVSYYTVETNIPRDYAHQLCVLFAEFGIRGISVLYATGNWGVGLGNCFVEDNTGNVRALFQPAFPASCPWVTSVGGTTNDSPEVAASISGGGFSYYFPRPKYQTYAVPPFFQNTKVMYEGQFDPSGRGIPDISAQALNFVFVHNGEYHTLSGTSASTPTVAGIISLLNDYRISKGKIPLGFLNPWLYSIALGGLNDVTAGSNPGCGTEGFPAKIGWDPVTGLGTPDFEKLEEIIDDWLEWTPNLPEEPILPEEPTS